MGALELSVLHHIQKGAKKPRRENTDARVLMSKAVADMDHKRKLRDYQVELVGVVLGEHGTLGNGIVCLPTGTGKTEVAFAVASEARRRFPAKYVLFLANTGELVKQQARRYTHDTGRRVTVLGGGKGSLSARQGADVFATPQAFLNEVDRGRTSIGRVSLLIVDECHHSIIRLTSNNKADATMHPQKRVAELALTAPPHTRPMLLGLTASPGESEHDIANLCELYRARLLLPSSSPSQDPGCHDAPDVELHNIECDVTPVCDAILESIGNGQRANLPGDVLGKLAELHTYARVVGLDTFQRLRKRYDYMEEEHFGVAVDIVTTIRTELGLPPPQSLRSGLYKKLLALVLEQGPGKQTLVFASKVRSAKALKECLARDLVRVGGEAWTGKVHTVVGANSGGSTSATNVATLDGFRNNEIACIVATSVLEEGIDVPSCSLVVRTEPPQTIIQNIQSRGRARFPQSRYVILSAGREEVRQATRLQAREQQLLAEQRAFADSQRDMPAAANSWNTDPPEEDEVAEGGDSAAASALGLVSFPSLGAESDDEDWLVDAMSALQTGGLPESAVPRLGMPRAGEHPFAVEIPSHQHPQTTNGTDWKSRLNLLVQQALRPADWQMPELVWYDTSRVSGPDHLPGFRSCVTVCNLQFTGGVAPKKKACEQLVARLAVEFLQRAALPS